MQHQERRHGAIDRTDHVIESGKVTPAIDRTYPLNETAAALTHVGGRHTRGKTVISVISDT